MSDPFDITPEDWSAIGTRLDEFIEHSSMTLPLEVFITGADGDEVVHFSIAKDRQIRPLCPSRTLTARFPLSVSITDVDENGVTFKITPDLTVQ